MKLIINALGERFTILSLRKEFSNSWTLFCVQGWNSKPCSLSLINITLVLRGLNGHHTVGRGW